MRVLSRVLFYRCRLSILLIGLSLEPRLSSHASFIIRTILFLTQRRIFINDEVCTRYSVTTLDFRFSVFCHVKIANIQALKWFAALCRCTFFQVYKFSAAVNFLSYYLWLRSHARQERLTWSESPSAIPFGWSSCTCDWSSPSCSNWACYSHARVYCRSEA